MISDTKKILAVGAHPDDVEIMCAGTLFLLGDLGYEIHVATMSLGDCGSMEHASQEVRRIRRAEAEDACRILDATYHYVGFSDFSIFNNDETNRTTALLRDIDPEMVFTHPPQDYMTDHETTSLLVRNACFVAPAPNYDTLGYTPTVRSSAIPYLFYTHPMEEIDLFGNPVEPHSTSTSALQWRRSWKCSPGTKASANGCELITGLMNISSAFVVGTSSWPRKRRRFRVARCNTPRASVSIAAIPILAKTFCRNFSGGKSYRLSQVKHLVKSKHSCVRSLQGEKGLHGELRLGAKA